MPRAAEGRFFAKPTVESDNGLMLSTKKLIEQLRHRLTQDAAIAARAGAQAAEAAKEASPRSERKAAMAYSNLAHAQGNRVEKTRDALRQLDSMAQRRLPRFSNKTPIGVGAIIEALGEDDNGEYARTFVMLPVGAGEELTGPNGDGIIHVLTPQSPVGRAMFGKRAGDIAEVMVRREPFDWEILEVG